MPRLTTIETDQHQKTSRGVELLTESEGIACRGCNNHDESQHPLEDVRTKRCAKRLSRDPEVGVRQNTLSTNLTKHTCRSNQHSKKVTKGTQQYKKVEDIGSRLAITKELGEEDGCSNLTSLGELLLGNDSEVGDVAEHIQHSDDRKRHSTVSLERGDGILNLVDDVEGVPVSSV